LALEGKTLPIPLRTPEGKAPVVESDTVYDKLIGRMTKTAEVLSAIQINKAMGDAVKTDTNGQKPASPFSDMIEAGKALGLNYSEIMKELREGATAAGQAATQAEQTLHEEREAHLTAQLERIEAKAKETASKPAPDLGEAMGVGQLTPEVKTKLQMRMFGIRDGTEPVAEKPAAAPTALDVLGSFFTSMDSIRDGMGKMALMMGFVPRDQVVAATPAQGLLAIKDLGNVPPSFAIEWRKMDLEDAREQRKITLTDENEKRRLRMLEEAKNLVTENLGDFIGAFRETARTYNAQGSGVPVGNKPLEEAAPNGAKPEPAAAAEAQETLVLACAGCKGQFMVLRAQLKPQMFCPHCGVQVALTPQAPEAQPAPTEAAASAEAPAPEGALA